MGEEKKDEKGSCVNISDDKSKVNVHGEINGYAIRTAEKGRHGAVIEKLDRGWTDKRVIVILLEKMEKDEEKGSCVNISDDKSKVNVHGEINGYAIRTAEKGCYGAKLAKERRHSAKLTNLDRGWTDKRVIVILLEE